MLTHKMDDAAWNGVSPILAHNSSVRDARTPRFFGAISQSRLPFASPWR